MQRKSQTDPLNDLLNQKFINLRVTHKKTPISLLETLTFRNPHESTLQSMKIANLSECVLLQTCNRIEFYLVTQKNPRTARRAIINYWLKEMSVPRRDLLDHLEVSIGDEVLRHLLKLTAGLESMIVGEDQILGQIRDSLNKSKSLGTVGPLLKMVFTKAIRSGGKIRALTKINKGAVSIGSVSVTLMEKKFRELERKKIMIIGAGETGTLVGKTLASRGCTAIYVANRTFNRAKNLARFLGGQAIQYNKIDNLIPKVDIIFVATSAPHMTLKKKQVAVAMRKRSKGKLLIFDLSQPRNVESEISSIKNVSLFDIDDLQNITKENIQTRSNEIKKAERLIKNELKSLKITLRKRRFDPLISQICNQAEHIRKREFMKAHKLLGKIDNDQQRIIEKLTRIIVDKIMQNPVNNLRRAAENEDTEIQEIASMLFNLKKIKTASNKTCKKNQS